MTKIHNTALIHKNAQIASDVEIGPYTIIGANVKIGKGSKIRSHVVIDGRTNIGENCLIFPSAVIGTIPQDLKYSGEKTQVIIGSKTTIREFVTINLSTSIDQPTTVGNNCLLMAYVHVAHNCKLGDNVIMANAATLAGHVEVENNATIGGLTPVHQFVKIGCYSFIGGLSRVSKDVAPYTRGASIPYKTIGLNSIGLRRHNFSDETMQSLKKLYKIFYTSNLNTTQAIEKIEANIEPIYEVNHFVNFVKKSERGILK